MSIYKFQEHDGAFTIKCKGRKPVTVSVEGYGIRVSNQGHMPFHTYSISQACASELVRVWKPPLSKRQYFVASKTFQKTAPENPIGPYRYPGESLFKPEFVISREMIRIPWVGWEPKWFGINNWVKDQCVRGICKGISGHLPRLRAQIPTDILAAQKKIFSVGFNVFSPNLQDPEWWGQISEWTIRDIGKYRGAAAIAYLASGETDSNPAGLDNWLSILSPDGESYTSLNRTLMNLPGNILPSLLKNLRSVRLTRPIMDRVELIALCAYLQKHQRDARPYVGIFMNARRDEISRAINLFTNSEVSLRGQKQIIGIIEDIADYSEPHTGRLVGLAERSREWHLQDQRVRVLKSNNLNEDDAVAQPPISLPEVQGITFLNTVGAILAEGNALHHCAASCAPKAHKGHSYIFHADHGGRTATIEVDPFLRTVTQARGPYNKSNEATRWAERILAKWAQELPEIFK